MSFRRRTYPEVLENLLTSLTGGVASESQPFPPAGASAPPFTIPLLQPPAADVVSVWGSRDGQPHEFRKGIDYTLSADGRSLEVPEKGAELPDPGTLFYVNYVPAGAQPELTDVQVGSVVRTLVETTALELGRIYALLETVYESAFVDTASGDALDNVVALLGIDRILGGRPAGEVEFARARGATGELTIPAGTRVATADGKTQYETTGTVSMSAGQSSIRVAVRDLEPNPPQPASALTLLLVPIAGIESVTNPSPTAIATQDETDVELRTRAKNFLHGSERATLGALEHAVRGVGITADIDEAATPGKVTITPHVESLPPDLLQRLTESIELVRPAGVVVEIGAPQAPRKVDLELRLTTADGLLAQDLRAAQRSVRDRIGDFFARLPAKEAASINQLVGLALGVNGVQDVKLVTASLQPTNGGPPDDVLDVPGGILAIAGFPTVLGELHIADPNLPTTLNVTVTYPPEAAPADVNALRSALNEALVAVNEANGEDGLDLVYGQLLAAAPLPGHTAAPIALPSSGTLPTETDVAPYAVSFVFTLESGLSQILAAAGETYAMTPFERLALGAVDGGPSGG
jgi:baseplate J-like protein